jgi:hypothetical protein
VVASPNSDQLGRNLGQPSIAFDFKLTDLDSVMYRNSIALVFHIGFDKWSARGPMGSRQAIGAGPCG